jgi:hypothetical protein
MRWYPFEQKKGVDGIAKYRFNVDVYNTGRVHKNNKAVNMREDSQHYDCLIAYKLVLNGGCCLSTLMSNALKYLCERHDEEFRAAERERRLVVRAGEDEASDDGSSDSEGGEDMEQGYALLSITGCDLICRT